MPAAAFNKFDCFTEDVANKLHDLKTGTTDTFRVMLTNVAPVAANRLKADITQIASGNGYTTDGNAAAHTSGVQTAGVFKLVLADPAVWTGGPGTMASFRYAVLYNFAASLLIGWYDYGSSIALSSGETFTCDLDQVNGVLTIT